jgi:cell fate (sporulation/competence/biofilm development) regulator YmcA (YheA/YmcA/DUF963 family)
MNKQQALDTINTLVNQHLDRKDDLRRRLSEIKDSPRRAHMSESLQITRAIVRTNNSITALREAIEAIRYSQL